MQTNPKDQEKVDKETGAWQDPFIAQCQDLYDPASITQSTFLYSLSMAPKSQRVLEIGLGPGTGARIFINGLMKRGSSFWGVELREKVINYNIGQLKSTDFSFNPNNKIQEVKFEEGQKIDIEAHETDLNEDGKLVSMVQANAVDLPFEDDSFDAVIAGYVCTKYRKVMPEYLRIAKKGAFVCLSLEGRKSENSIDSMIKDSIKEVKGEGLDHRVESICEMKNVESLEDMNEYARSLGFTYIKSFFIPHKSHLTTE